MKRGINMPNQQKYKKGDFVETSRNEPGIVQEDGEGRVLVEVWGSSHEKEFYCTDDLFPISKEKFEEILQYYSQICGYDAKSIIEGIEK